jgi:HEAT repeat protein
MSRKITAAELMAELRGDPEFVAQRERKEQERQKRGKEFDRAAAPLVNALRDAGVRVKSVWDLIPAHSYVEPGPAPFPQALPVLLEHLSGPYPEAVREGIARALGSPDAKFAWPVLLQHYRAEQSKRVKDGLAVAIAAVSDDELIGDVILLVRDTDHGPSRLLLLDALRRSRDPRAYQALRDLAADPVLEEEIRAILRRSRRAGRQKR